MVSSFYFFIFICVSLTKATNYTTKNTCGNGIRDVGEECDDGNNNGLDGCTANCTVQAHYLCTQRRNSQIDVCFQETPLIAQLIYVPHSNPAEVQMLFNHPITYQNYSTFSSSFFLYIEDMDSQYYSWTFGEDLDYEIGNQSFIITLSFSQSIYQRKLKLIFRDLTAFQGIFKTNITTKMLEVGLPWHITFTEISNEFIIFTKGLILTVMILMLILCLPLSILNSMGMFWNLFESCQLIQILTLINCDYPNPVKEFFKAFAITNFRLIDYFNENIDLNSQYVEDPNLPFWIEDRGYHTMFLANAFYSLIFIALFVISFIILWILSKFRSNPASWPMKLRNIFGYSMLLRMTLVTYTPLCLAMMLQFLYLKFDNVMNFVNSTFSLCCVFYSVVIPWIYLKLLNKKSIIDDEEGHRMKIMPLIELLNLKAILKRNFQIFYALRKFCWVLFIVTLGDDVLSQMFWVIFVQLCLITLHKLKRPYTDMKINYMLLLTEILLLIVLFLIAFLVGFDYLNEDVNLNIRIGISWAIISTLSFIVLVKMCFMIFLIAKNIKNLLPKARKMFRDFSSEGGEYDDDNFIEMGEYNIKNSPNDLKGSNNFEPNNNTAKNPMLLNKS